MRVDNPVLVADNIFDLQCQRSNLFVFRLDDPVLFHQFSFESVTRGSLVSKSRQRTRVYGASKPKEVRSLVNRGLKVIVHSLRTAEAVPLLPVRSCLSSVV